MNKILIVEDELTTRKVIARTVSRLGHSSIEASNGFVAWQILNDNPDISLLITDMVMPDMDGWQLLEKLKADSRLTSLPVIIVSGYVKLHEINDILIAGASRFLPKPIDVHMLAEYIELLLANSLEESTSRRSRLITPESRTDTQDSDW